MSAVKTSSSSSSSWFTCCLALTEDDGQQKPSAPHREFPKRQDVYPDFVEPPPTKVDRVYRGMQLPHTDSQSVVSIGRCASYRTTVVTTVDLTKTTVRSPSEDGGGSSPQASTDKPPQVSAAWAGAMSCAPQTAASQAYRALHFEASDQEPSKPRPGLPAALAHGPAAAPSVQMPALNSSVSSLTPPQLPAHSSRSSGSGDPLILSPSVGVRSSRSGSGITIGIASTPHPQSGLISPPFVSPPYRSQNAHVVTVPVGDGGFAPLPSATSSS